METSDSQPTAREQKGKKIKAAANSGLWRAEPAPSGTRRPRGTTSGTAPVSVPSGAGSGRRLFLLTALYLMGPPGRARGRRPGACFPGRSGHPPGTRSASPQGLGGAGRTARGRTRSGAHCLQSHVPGGGVSHCHEASPPGHAHSRKHEKPTSNGKESQTTFTTTWQHKGSQLLGEK